MRLRRGDVHAHTNFIQRQGAANYRLIVASSPLAEDDNAATVLTLHVYDSDKGGLLSVGVGDLGFASAAHVETTIQTRLGPPSHSCTAEEMDAVDRALRAALFDG